MMPDLGPYGVTVAAAYGAAIVMILALVGLSLWQGARMKRRLADVETRAKEATP